MEYYKVSLHFLLRYFINFLFFQIKKDISVTIEDDFMFVAIVKGAWKLDWSKINKLFNFYFLILNFKKSFK